MKNEPKKPYIIVLIKNGELIPQYGLSYYSREAAQKIVDYMNSILPTNIHKEEFYTVMANREF